MKLGGVHHHIWWHVSDKATWALPLWRPYCWIVGHEEFVDMDGRTRSCVVCLKSLPDYERPKT
jgi:hypothetical protein